jgi:AMMECR1 domain-containing protein
MVCLGMARLRTEFASIIACIILCSCTQQEVHLHDRHSLSYPLIESYAKRHPGATLVLIDYHHDIGPVGEAPVSSNWVATLLQKKLVSQVVWVSGRDLLLPNRNARIAWLQRKLASFPPSDAASIESRVILSDWHELEEKHIKGPIIVSLDLDVFCHDPGTPPERFVDEISAWTGRQSPGLVTISLSAAYENDPESAWQRLERFAVEYARVAPKAIWYLEAGSRTPGTEGIEESNAWRIWERQPESFYRRNACFLPGACIWIAPPISLREDLVQVNIQPGDEVAKDIISGWRDGDLAALERSFPQGTTDKALEAASAAIEEYWRGKRQPQPRTSDDDRGVALRVRDTEGDRGCLALYRGVADPIGAAAYCAQFAADDPRYPELLPSERSNLMLEVSILGPWHDMSGPLDFRPGLDSLILKDGGEVTFLQSSVAAQRGYGREEFLARLSNKAGLGLDGWKIHRLQFMRSSTIWSRRSMSSIEAAPDHQKSEKK